MTKQKEKRGGARPNAGPIKVAHIRKAYRVPRQFELECGEEIKAVLKKWRELTDDYKKGKAARGAAKK